jgi:hypothetical protein
VGLTRIVVGAVLDARAPAVEAVFHEACHWPSQAHCNIVSRRQSCVSLEVEPVKEEKINRARLMTLTTPGLPLFAGDDGEWGTAFSLPRMHQLTLGLPDHPRNPGGELSNALVASSENDEIVVYVKPEDKWPTGLQFLNFPVLKHMDAELASAVLGALYAWYPTLYTTYDFLLDNEDQAYRLPRLNNPEMLRPLVRLNYVVIHPVQSITPYLGLGFSCSWDEEHGLGLMTFGTEILEIGLEDTALSTSVAQEHYTKLVKQLKLQKS